MNEDDQRLELKSMNAFKIWITTHPTEPGNREISFTERDLGVIYSETTGEYVYVDCVEHICIPIQE